MPSRWELLLEAKPVSLVEHLIEQAARLLAEDLSTWPLPIVELDVETGGHFAPVLAPDSLRPDPRVFAEGLRLARWELEREIDAVDDYMRNRRWLEHGLSPADKLALSFISRWTVERLLALRESTEGRVTRAQLVDCLERARSQLGAPVSSAGGG
jgi:hypothetical protein